MFRQKSSSAFKSHTRRLHRARPHFEPLEDRRLLAVFAVDTKAPALDFPQYKSYEPTQAVFDVGSQWNVNEDPRVDPSVATGRNGLATSAAETAIEYPTPLSSSIPLGSLIFDHSETGAIDSAGEQDIFNLLIDPGQTLTVVIDPSPGLRPVIEVRDQGGLLLGSATASAAGESVVLQTLPTHGQLGMNAPPPRTYSIAVSSADGLDTADYVLWRKANGSQEGHQLFRANFGDSTTGSYTVRAILNAAVEEESDGGIDNNTLVTAQDLTAAFLPLHGSVADSDAGRPERAGVLGRIEGPSTATDLTGPDAFGYVAFAVPFAFEDISATGTHILQGFDDGFDFIDLGAAGFSFEFYGNTFTSLFASTNGLINFDSGSFEFSNTDLTNLPEATIAPFWDDLDTYSPGSVVWEVRGLGDDQRLVLQWNNVHFLGASDPINFQAVLSEADNSIQFNYLDLQGGAFGNEGLSATVGIKDVGFQGSNRLLVSFNAGPNAFVGTGRSTRIEIFPPTPDYYSFHLNAGESATLALTSQGDDDVALEFQNAGGSTLALADTGATNVDAAISNFVAATTGTYYARVTGDAGATYSLVITRNADFDIEANDTIATAQQLIGTAAAGRRWALGHVGEASEGGLVQFDELPTQPVNGLSTEGVTFGFTIDSSPSLDATYHSGGPGQTLFVQDPSLEGSAAGILTLDFQSPTTFLQFGVVLSTFGTLSPGVVVQLFDSALNLISTTPLQTQDEGFSYSEAQFTYSGAAVARAVLDFNESAATRFVFDNLVFNTGSTADFFRINANELQTIEIETRTPGGASGEFVNDLDPMIRLHRADGTIVSENDNGDVDGRNSRLRYRVPRGQAGTYYVEVLPSTATETPTQGEYVVSVKGDVRELPTFQVVSTDLPDGGRVRGPLTEITVDFNDTILLSSLQAADLTVGGVAATGVTVVDANTVTFTLPAVGEGLQNLAIAAGAILDVQNTPLQAFALPFYHDVTAPRIVALNVQQDAVLAPGDLTFVVTFSEPMDVDNLDLSDFELLGELRAVNYAPGSFGYNNTGTVLSLNYTNLPEDRYRLTLFSGDSQFEDTAGPDGWNLDGEPLAFPIPPNQSGDGIEGGDFFATFHLDVTSAAFPTPLTPKLPLGSLIYDPTVSGLINFAGDTDSFTLNVDAGQTITVVVDPASTLQPTIQLRDPSNVVIGVQSVAAVGQDAVLQTIAAATAGAYTITVGGVGTTIGAYSLQVVLNSAVDAEDHNGPTNNTLSTAQNIDASFTPLLKGATRGAVMGRIDAAGAYNATAVPFSFADITATGTNVLSSGDDVTASVNIGFAFNFFGVNYSSLFVSSNGLITFGSSNNSFNNSDLTTFPSQASIAPFWDDLVISNVIGSARVKTQLIGAVGSRQLIIQWDRIRFFGGVSNDTVTFQAVLSEGTGNIQFNYLDLVSSTALGNNGGSATVGIKGVGNQGPNRLLLGFNNGPNTFVGSGKSTLLVPVSPVDLYSFTVASGDRATLGLTSLSGGNVDLALLNAGGSVLATGSTAQTNMDEMIYDFGPLAAGTYIARVTGTTNVNFSLVVLRNAVFDREANDTLVTAQPFGGTTVSLGHLGSSDLDHYSFTAADGAAIDLFTATPADGPGEFGNTLNPRLRLFNPSGSEVGIRTTFADGRNERIVYSVPVGGAGTYVLVVEAEGGTSGEYILDPITANPDAGLRVVVDAQATSSVTVVHTLSPRTHLEYTVARTGIRTNGHAAFKRLAHNEVKIASDSRQVHRTFSSPAADVLQYVDEAFENYEEWERRSSRVLALAKDLDSKLETYNERDLVFAAEVS